MVTAPTPDLAAAITRRAQSMLSALGEKPVFIESTYDG
jgi:hypothetical protein